MHVYPFSITKASLLVVSVLDMLWRCLHFGVSVGVCCDMWDRRPLTRPHEPILRTMDYSRLLQTLACFARVRGEKSKP